MMLHVVWNETESRTIWQEERDCYSAYIFNILDDLGFPYKVWRHGEWIEDLPAGLTLVLGKTDDDRWTAACAAYCEQGNGLLAVGGAYGLDETLGVSVSGSLREGWVHWEGGSLAEGLQSSFHFFDAVCIKANHEDVKSLGGLIHRNGTPMAEHPAATFRKLGKGCASLLAINIMKTFCMIQQGVSVIRDGAPSSDRTAAIDDGMLKTDDAVVLDWQRDRDEIEGGSAAFFLHPVVDEWRIVFARMIYRLLQETETLFVQRWFWPRGLPAIGHISHDTDGNSPEHARKLLNRLKEVEINSTWCMIMPGYDSQINRLIVDGGHEVALHYNAMDMEIEQSHWSEEHFRFQLDMLQEQFPEQTILSNKNHYLRWEGDVQFYKWCERAGIRVEQSFGGTKQGNKGFLAGTCHPYRPVSKADEQNRPIDLVSLPVLSWDPPMEIRCTAKEALALLNRSLDVNGVAHFLFHPQMLLKNNDEVGEMLVELVEHGKSQGLEWWTSAHIWQWLQQRNQVAIELVEQTNHQIEIVVISKFAIRGLTLLLPEGLESGKITAADNEAVVCSLHPVKRFGCDFVELQLDIQAGKTILLLNEIAERNS